MTMTQASDIQKTPTQSKVVTPDILRQDYQFIRLLGEGSNGKTWLAVRRKDQKKVAIKALKLLDNFKSLELFKREAEALRQIQTEGVPKFIDFIESTNAFDTCYLIQEFLDFPSLQDMIDENQANGKIFSEGQTLEIMASIAEILHILQTRYSPPVIHRDIKPSNILYDKLQNKAMLIDFGAVAAPAKKTDGSTVAGTQGFMAPEQMLGECTTQSDFYSLGATALYMLTGISPVNMSYDKANPFQLKFDEIFKNTYISRNTQTLIQTLMSPQAENRPQNTTELIDTIQNTKINIKSQHHMKKNELVISESKMVLSVLLLGILSAVLLISFTNLTSETAIFLIGIPICISLICIKSIIPKKPSKSINHCKNESSALPCLKRYNVNMTIQDYLPDGTAKCAYYCTLENRYKFYCGKVSPGQSITLEKNMTYNVVDGTKQFQRIS